MEVFNAFYALLCVIYGVFFGWTLYVAIYDRHKGMIILWAYIAAQEMSTRLFHNEDVFSFLVKTWVGVMDE